MDRIKTIKTRRNFRVDIKLNAEEYTALCDLRAFTGSSITKTIVEALEISILYKIGKIGKIGQQVIGGGDENSKTT